jgi:hypothetical protein
MHHLVQHNPQVSTGYSISPTESLRGGEGCFFDTTTPVHPAEN